MSPKVKKVLNVIIVILLAFSLYLIFIKDSKTSPVGIYAGVLPCADCEGIRTKLTVRQDFTYFLETQYIGKSDEIFTEVGKWTPSEDGKIIQLGYDKNEDVFYKIVNRRTLEKLDQEGNEIKSDMNYKLEKL